MDEHITFDTDNGDSDHNSLVGDDNPVITSDNNDDDSFISSDEDTIFSDLSDSDSEDDTSTTVSDDTHGNGPAPGDNLDNAEAAVFINNYPVSSS
jgi:hypothetical protein